uniref:Uncharacterized protein n=1 Tax=Tanacetum cinerariifolium TaxID=118510 RepID=A0A6L2J1D3_TANCI|nr:hypothetical protein [Tanacetum cinerariifolium]
MTESPLVDSGLVVPAFSLGDDLIACLNKAMDFLTAVASLRFPLTTNQLRNFSNIRNQATIQDGRVTVQQVQGRQGQSYYGTGYKSNATSYGGNNASRQTWVVKCYNYQVISNKHVAMPVIDNEETLILEEANRLKMAEKYKYPEAIKRKFSNKPIDYVKLNKIYMDFGKCFVPKQELLADEAVWYNMLNPSTKSYVALLVQIEAPKELPKVSLVNESLKKMKLHFANFDIVVKIKTTPNARTEDE